MNGQENEIIAMGHEARLCDEEGCDDNSIIITDHMTRFAKLVAAKEREACIVDIQMHIPRSGRDTVEYKMAMRMIERIKARA